MTSDNQSSPVNCRVVHIIDSLNGGGAEMVVLRLHHSINQLPGAESFVIALSQKADYVIPDDDRLQRLSFKSNKNLDGWLHGNKVKRELTAALAQIEQQSGHIDAIYSHLDVSHAIVSRLETKIPRHYVVHASCQAELNTARKRNIFNYLRLKRRKQVMHGQSLVTVSDGVQSELHGQIPWLVAGQACTIYNPFDLSAIETAGQADDAAIPAEPYILHIGRVSSQKRHDRLLEAYKASGTRVKLVLLTKASAKLSKLIDKFGLQQQVIVQGFVQNPFVWLKNARLLVLSSDYEGLPNVLIESLLSRTPVLSTDCPHGPAEILKNFQPDWLVPMTDIAQLAIKIKTMAEQPATVDLHAWPLYQRVQAPNVALAYLQHALAHQAEQA